MKHFAKNLVVVGCLIALGAFGTWVVLRPRLPRGDGFTDGEQFVAATRARDELRLARWEAPQFLAQLAESGSASDPFVDGASGRIFFVKGEPGAEELWLATPEGERFVVRPLTELNSPRRDTAPCFADGWLWFASDRAGGQGGLDLWRAPLAGDRFLAAENLGEPLNTAADETDPALRRRTTTSGELAPAAPELWFASNRETTGTGDFDLVFAKSDGFRFSPPLLAEALQSPFDERAPAFPPDGRLVLFASNRPGGAGGFDLWRALEKAGEFQTPANLGTPNGGGDDVAPALTDDGFTLLYASDREQAGRFELLKTRTRELFPVEAPRFTLADFTVLLLLVLVALLAWLARRWEALDVLYKCLVVSLLVHLLFLWWTRRVDVEAEARALTAAGGETWEVRLLGDVLAEVARLEDRAQGEQVAAASLDLTSKPSRSTALPDVAESAPSDDSSVERAPSGSLADAAAPDAAAATRERGSSPSIAAADPVQVVLDSFEPMAGAAAPLQVAASASGATTSAPSVAPANATFTPSARTAAGSADSAASAREPAGARAERAVTNGESRAPAPGPQARELLPVTRARAENAGRAVATATPTDRAETTGADAASGASATPAALALAPSTLPASGRDAARGESLVGAPHRRATPGSAAPVAEGGPRSEAPLVVPAAAPAAGAGGAPVIAGGSTLARGPSAPQPRSASADPVAPLSRHAEPPLAGTNASGNGDGRDGQRGDASGSPRKLALAPVSQLPGSSRPTESGSPGNPGTTGGASAGPRAAAPVRASLLAASAAPELAPQPSSAKLELPIAPIAAAPAAAEVAGPTGVARLYERRFGEQKQVAVREGGGSEETERAVLAGLRYLAKVQRPKGFFGDANDVNPGSKYRDFRVGKTGLAVLAFLGAGHTHRSNTEFSENVARALGWIVARQDEGSGHFGNSESYSHGIATYALAECYAITKDEAIRPPLQKAIAHLLAMQTLGSGDPRKDGGWTYYYSEGPGVDSFPRASISAWQVMALESAKVGGLEVPDAALAAARTYFLKSFDPGFGGFRYTHNPTWINGGYGTLPASTPASMFALTLLGQKDHARVAAAEEYVVERLPAGYRFRGEDAFVRRGQANVYFWYYSTLALFCRGGSAWREWNDALKQTLLPSQQRDGSWDSIDVYAQRYANDDREDRSYTTAMCVLMLEVYYRYFTPLLGKLENP